MLRRLSTAATMMSCTKPMIIATGTMSADNVLAATAVRITGEARPGR